MPLKLILLCFIAPFYAVRNKGWLAVTFVTILTVFAWFPGVVGAIFVLGQDYRKRPSTDITETL
ncbi:MAG: YqaE/Pmp3 family membrane protein [Candidatus Dojkabacteria bacterium]